MAAFRVRGQTQHVKIGAVADTKLRLYPVPPYGFVTFGLVSGLIVQRRERFYFFSPRQSAFVPFSLCHSPIFLYLCTVLLHKARRWRLAAQAARRRGLFYSGAAASVSSASASGSGAVSFSGSRSTSVMPSGMLTHAPVFGFRRRARIYRRVMLGW